MKKKIFTIIILLMGGVYTFGQSFKLDATGTNDIRLRTGNTDRLNILNNGNVGIGIPTPLTKFHVQNSLTGITPLLNTIATFESVGPAYLSILHGVGNPAGILFANAVGGVTSGYMVYEGSINKLNFGTQSSTKMVIDGSGNVGIGTNIPSSKLEVSGNIRSSSLVGTGIRNVLADANGTLLANTQTYTMVVTPQSFQRKSNTGTGVFLASGPYGECRMSGAGATDNLVAPVNLPVGATITNASFYYTDTDANNNLRMFLVRTSLTNSGNGTIADLFQNTVNTNPYDISNIASGVLNELVTDGEYYYIVISPRNTTNTADSTWENAMSVKGVKITYTY
jgi:hypothetical protein